MTTRVILLPGAVMPAELAYGALLAALGDDVQAVAKELEIYADAEPPAGYTLQHETDGVLRTADAAGFDRFHLSATPPAAPRAWRLPPDTPSGC